VTVQGFFRKRPVFTYEEFAAFRDKENRHGARTSESLISYYTRKGHILRVRRGLFVVVQPGVDPRSCPVDPYLLAAKMTDDAVLAYHTAMEFLGKAYSAQHRFLYLTERNSRPLVFRDYRFRRVQIPKKLRDKGEKLFGVSTKERSGIDVRVTSFERTFVDMLDRPDLGGGWEEIWRSLEMVEFLDLERVVQYVLHLGNTTTIAKAGFFLEQHRKSLMVDEASLRSLREHRPRAPHYMIRRDRKQGRFVAEWNLVVPQEILRRSWGEIT
jgi:predicted transcriptional regulator of viral defense system